MILIIGRQAWTGPNSIEDDWMKYGQSRVWNDPDYRLLIRAFGPELTTHLRISRFGVSFACGVDGSSRPRIKILTGNKPIAFTASFGHRLMKYQKYWSTYLGLVRTNGPGPLGILPEQGAERVPLIYPGRY